MTKVANAIDEIIWINRWLADFWANSHGWAPKDAADLMSKSRLDYQVALSYTLKLWMVPCPDEEVSGRLILA